MTVHVVSTCDPYGAIRLEGVFSTFELADAFLATLKQQHWSAFIESVPVDFRAPQATSTDEGGGNG